MSSTAPARAIGLRLTRELPATQEEVYDAYTDPDAQRWWLSALGPDAGEVRTHVDLRVGGTWEATFLANPAVLVHDVFTFLELDRPRRIVTRHRGESTVDGRRTPAIDTHIVLDLAPTAGGAALTLEHTGFPDAQTRDFFETVAWPGGLDRLAAHLAGKR